MSVAVQGDEVPCAVRTVKRKGDEDAPRGGEGFKGGGIVGGGVVGEGDGVVVACAGGFGVPYFVGKEEREEEVAGPAGAEDQEVHWRGLGWGYFQRLGRFDGLRRFAG